jgi:hypothetical protein
VADAAKTIRFAQVVSRSGRPHVHTLWVAPEKDAELRRAQKDHRVMTVLSGNGGKADTGVVGFERSKSAAAQVLIFPQSLARFADRRRGRNQIRSRRATEALRRARIENVMPKNSAARKNLRRESCRRPAAAPAPEARSKEPKIVPFVEQAKESPAPAKTAPAIPH